MIACCCLLWCLNRGGLFLRNQTCLCKLLLWCLLWIKSRLLVEIWRLHRINNLLLWHSSIIPLSSLRCLKLLPLLLLLLSWSLLPILRIRLVRIHMLLGWITLHIIWREACIQLLLVLGIILLLLLISGHGLLVELTHIILSMHLLIGLLLLIWHGLLHHWRSLHLLLLLWYLTLIDLIEPIV